MMETSQRPSQCEARFVLAATLFSMAFSSILTDAFRDCQEGLHIRLRADGGLFNLRLPQRQHRAEDELPP